MHHEYWICTDRKLHIRKSSDVCVNVFNKLNKMFLPQFQLNSLYNQILMRLTVFNVKMELTNKSKLNENH